MVSNNDHYIQPRTPTFEMLAEIFDRAGLNFNESAIEKMEPAMLEFLMEYTKIVINAIPQQHQVLSRIKISNEDVNRLIKFTSNAQSKC